VLLLKLQYEFTSLDFRSGYPPDYSKQREKKRFLTAKEH